MEVHPETFEICIEVVRGGRVKRRPNGSIDFVSPISSPFNYGSVTGRLAADGDPEDALVLGPALSAGTVVRRKVWGRVLFQDAGVPDHKWICSKDMPTEAEWTTIETFFRWYVWAKRVLYVIRWKRGAVKFVGLERFSNRLA
jgi:inorganic pyrophosphatase